MTIYDLLYVMDNMPYDVVIFNDAFIDGGGKHEVIRGDVSDITSSDEYDNLQYEDVTDVFTDDDGTMYICFNNEDY